MNVLVYHYLGGISDNDKGYLNVLGQLILPSW